MRITITLSPEQWSRFSISCARSSITEIPNAVVAKSLFLRGLKLEEDIADESIRFYAEAPPAKVGGTPKMTRTRRANR